MEIKNLNYLYQNKDIKNNFFIDYQNILLAVIYIYLIENVKTGKKYVGKTTNIKNRISQYIRASYIENNNRDITKALFDDFSYIFIIPSENENKFETSDLCDVFKYYKMVSGSGYG